jgi:uncharacterized protein YvpB
MSLLTVVVVAATQPPSVAAAYPLIEPLDVPVFYQSDGLWASDQLGTCESLTIKSSGCAVTSLAMLYAYYGVTVQGPGQEKGMSPRILDYWLTTYGGYGGGCLINWTQAKAPSTMRILIKGDWINDGLPGYNLAGLNASGRRAAIADELAKGHPVIAWVDWYGMIGGVTKYWMHFVVIKGQTAGGDFYINDPAGLSTTLFSAYRLHGIRTYEPTSATVTVDDTSPSFVWWTVPAANSSRTIGYAAHMFYARTIGSSGQSVIGVWYGNLPSSGSWRVFAWIPRQYAGTAGARYDVTYGVGPYGELYHTIVSVSQAAYADKWVELGTFNFQGGVSKVTLTNITGESGLAIAFDAVKFVKQ